jgi:hypothetical protein
MMLRFCAHVSFMKSSSGRRWETYKTETQMNRRRRWLELLRRLSILDHANNVPCYHASLLGAGSCCLVRSSVGNITEGEDIGEFLALELERRLYEDAAIGRIYERSARRLCKLGNQAVVGRLSSSHDHHVCSQTIAIGELDLHLVAILWNPA